MRIQNGGFSKPEHVLETERLEIEGRATHACQAQNNVDSHHQQKSAPSGGLPPSTIISKPQFLSRVRKGQEAV